MQELNAKNKKLRRRNVTRTTKRLTQQRDVSSRLKRMTWGGGRQKKKERERHLLWIHTRLSQTLKRMGPRECRGEAMDLATDHTKCCQSFELFRSSVFSFSPYLSYSSLFLSPFQISHRDPSHSSSLVHRSLAMSMVPDWSSSKRGRISRPFDPLLGLLGQGENSLDSPGFNTPLLSHSTIMCTLKCFFLFFCCCLHCDKKQTLNSPSPNTTSWPSVQLPNIPFALCEILLI